MPRTLGALYVFLFFFTLWGLYHGVRQMSGTWMRQAQGRLMRDMMGPQTPTQLLPSELEEFFRGLEGMMGLDGAQEKPETTDRHGC